MEKTNNNENQKIVGLAMLILVILILIAGSTFAYFAFSVSNNSINGSAGNVNMTLTVTKVLPNINGTNNLLLANYSEMAANINNDCAYNSTYTMCQIYQVTLTSASSSVNVNVTGSISFNNTTSPNLSWILLDDFNTSTTYTASDLPATYNTATSSFNNFVSSQTLNAGNSLTYYILVWINETTDVQTDSGSYTGTVRFEDANGKGVSSTFNN